MREYAKAIAGTAVAGLGAILLALVTPGITAEEWIVIAITVITAAGTIWAVPNAEKKAAV